MRRRTSRPALSLLSRSLLVVATLCPLPASSGAAQTLRGYLRDAQTQQPIEHALLVMLTESRDSVTYAVTNERGYFSVTSPKSGSFLLVASALGYREKLAGVFDLGMGAEMTLDIRVAPAPLAIDSLLVGVERPVLEHYLVRNGFVHRSERNVGGYFITPHDIEKSSARTTEGLFSGVRGITVRSSSGVLSPGDRVLMHSPTGREDGVCTPTIFVDAVSVRYDHTAGVSLSAIVPLEHVLAVEVYRSPAEIPVEFNITRRYEEDLCGVLVFWTRVAR